VRQPSLSSKDSSDAVADVTAACSTTLQESDRAVFRKGFLNSTNRSVRVLYIGARTTYGIVYLKGHAQIYKLGHYIFLFNHRMEEIASIVQGIGRAPTRTEAQNSLPMIRAKNVSGKSVPEFLLVQPDEEEKRRLALKNDLLEKVKPTEASVAKVRSCRQVLVSKTSSIDIMHVSQERTYVC
jgi:hypothetical protein